MQQREIELLAPAKNADIGIEAIRHGADAVYIGAPRFGARAAAGCSVDDIARLVRFAHQYRAKVYVTLNTLLYDDELKDAEQLVWQLYEVKVDALIVQDMALLKMNLPPIALHASTQCNNRTKEKVQFLADCGFSQVVLARELSLDEIREIASSTTAKIECFVHGALCVSYSGQCYMSHDYCQRSANRGECAQMCRLPYTLLDGNGNILMERRHLLSLKDFNASSRLKEMIEAGAVSFKIEGRLKDVDYVKNVTAYYRKLLDRIIVADSSLRRASSGLTSFSFIPKIEKSFSRGFTTYFLDGRQSSMASMNTPKSLGEEVGRVVAQERNAFVVNSSVELHNGDGLCMISADGEVFGCRLNRVDQNRCYPLQMPQKRLTGSMVYRNFDIQYSKMLENPSTADRRIGLSVCIEEKERQIVVTLKDEDGVTLTRTLMSNTGELAKSLDRQTETWRTQFSKLGDTIFAADNITVELNQGLFFPVSQIAAFRRETLEAFGCLRLESYRLPRREPKKETLQAPFATLGYQGNVANTLARTFYQELGVDVTQPAFECRSADSAELMRTRYCLKYEMGLCLKRQNPNKHIAEPLTLSHGKDQWQLHFDCANCEMVVKKAERNNSF